MVTLLSHYCPHRLQVVGIPSMGIIGEKDVTIATMRGLACLLLVAFHVVGLDAAHGMEVAANSIWRGVCDILIYVRMPLFAFISGYIYAARPVVSSNIVQVYTGKLRRLGLPWLTITPLLYCAIVFTGGQEIAVTELHWLYLTPYTIMWYLPASLLLFLAVMLLDQYAWMKRRVWFALLLACACVQALFMPEIVTHILALNGALYLLPYFLLGMGMKRFAVMHTSPWLFGAVLLAYIALLMAVMFDLGHDDIFSKHGAIGLVIGGLSCIALLRLQPRSQLFAWIGQYSYSIYLFHLFFTAGTLMLTRCLSIEIPLLFQFITAVSAGIIGPMMIDKALHSHPLLRMFLLGERLPSKHV